MSTKKTVCFKSGEKQGFYSVTSGQNWYAVEEIPDFSGTDFENVEPGMEFFHAVDYHISKGERIIGTDIVQFLVQMWKGDEIFAQIQSGKILINTIDRSVVSLLLTKEAIFMLPSDIKWREISLGNEKSIKNEPVLLEFMRMIREDDSGNTIQIPRLETVVSKEEIKKFLEKYGEFSA